VKAVVELSPGKTVSDKEIIAFCKQHMARYKVPKSVEFAELLPKNPQGKILKSELRKKYWTGLEGEI
jgi:long-chain acyl-CoA synthetase